MRRLASAAPGTGPAQAGSVGDSSVRQSADELLPFSPKDTADRKACHMADWAARMEPSDRDPILAICLMAALADGRRSSSEQEEFAGIVSRLQGDYPSRISAPILSGELDLASPPDRFDKRRRP